MITIVECEKCGGTGQFMTTNCDPGYHQEVWELCDECDGAGLLNKDAPEPAPQRTRMRDWKQT